MKRLLLVLLLGAGLASPAFAQSDDSTDKPSGPPPGGFHHGGPLTDAEREKLHTAHDAAMKADPTLATQEKDLHEQMKALQTKINAAMVAADPTVAPIIAKMEAAHKGHGGPDGDHGGPDGPPPAN